MLQPLAEAWAALKDTEVGRGRKLVLGGRKGWKYEPILQRIDELGLRDEIVWLDFVPEGDLAVPLGQVAAAFPDVSMGSYPFGGVGAILVLRHQNRARLAEAADALRAALVPLGGAQAETPPE